MPSFPDPELICKNLLEEVGHQGPPTDIDAVCSVWPNVKIDEEDIDKEGYLLPLGIHGAEIIVRRKDPGTRKRFTIAHELGHWVLANLRASHMCQGLGSGRVLSVRTQHKRQTPEESWCHRFAACLLMPARDIHNYLYGSGRGNLPDRISRGHIVFQVSSEAFLYRIPATTPVSVFEVVSSPTDAKVRRTFLSSSLRKEKVDDVLNELLSNFQTTGDLPRRPVVVHGCEVQTKLTRETQYGRSWLVSIGPMTNTQAAP